VDLCVSLLSAFVPKFPNIKVPHGSNDSKYSIAKRDINHADSTKARIYAAWTQGSLTAQKIGESFAPEHPLLPQRSLDQWTAKLMEAHRKSTVPHSLLPQIEKLKSFSSIDAMEDESREDRDPDSPDVYQMAAVKDDEMKQILHDKISENLPAVCDSFDVD
jgi:hypothetical protein